VLPVGLLAALRPGTRGTLSAAAALVDPFVMPIALGSPWAPVNALESIVIDDVFGPLTTPRPLTRAQAMRIPAVARARHIVAGTIARVDLRAYRGDDVDPLPRATEPSWLAATDGPLSPLHRMLWTVDDLFFSGWSLWQVTARAAATSGAFPLRMQRVPMGSWQLEPDTGRVLTYQPDALRGGWTLQPAPARSVVLIPGPHEGLLAEGEYTLRHARDLQRSAHNAARFPSAYLGLEQTSGTPLKRHSDDASEVTVDTILADWRNARTNPEGGGVAWLGGVKAHEIGSFDTHLLESGRNAAAVDVARHASIPADLLDATVTESSLKYSTSRDNDRRAIDYGLGLYMGAISARLTQDDVTPHGQRVAFDLERWLEGAAPAPGQPAAAPAPGLSPSPAPGGDPTGVETPQ
jgi:hypothetical protein